MNPPPPPVRVGAVGLGRLGRQHAENLAFGTRGSELAAICSVDATELRRDRDALGRPAEFVDYSKMIAEADLDAVVLTSPSQFHPHQIIEAVENGIHVFCEKPLGLNTGECQRVVDVLSRHEDIVFMLGFMRRFDPSYLHAKSLVDSGAIGRPILFRGYSVDPVAEVESAIRYAAHSAGQFLDMAVHDFDLARWFLGAEARSIWAIGGCFAHPEFGQHSDGDNVAAMAQFDNDAMAFFLAGRTAAHGYHVETEIVGTEASLRIGASGSRDLVEFLGPGGARQEYAGNFIERFSTAYSAEIQAFVDQVRQGKDQPSPTAFATAWDGLQATRIALAATESFRSGEKRDLLPYP